MSAPPSSSPSSLPIWLDSLDPFSPQLLQSFGSVSIGSQPLLPIEIHRHILSHCDPSTLAAASLVNFTLLELSSELLYRDAVVSSAYALNLMFCSRVEPRQPSLERHLSLSQMRTLSLTSTKNELGRISHPPSLASFPPDPLHPLHPSLPLDRLTITLHHDHPQDRLIPNPPLILNWFNPREVVLEGGDGLSLSRTSAWTRIERLVLAGFSILHRLSGSGFALPGASYIAVYDLTKLGNQEERAERRGEIFYDLGVRAGVVEPDAFRDPLFSCVGLRRVEVWVPDEKERDAVLAMVAYRWGDLRGSQLEERRRAFQVLVKGVEEA